MTDIHGRDKQAISVLEHMDGQALRETFGCFVEISKHCVTPTTFSISRAMAPSDQINHVMMYASVKLMYGFMAQTMAWISAMILLLWN